jgi:ubiquinone/menaquinone biosynthesis C-methylase UbiE
MSRDYFDEKAAIWDDTATEKNSAKLADIVARMHLQPGSYLLDVGTGTGVLLPLLAGAIGPSGRIVGLDYAAAMLQRARHKNPGNSVSLVLADIASVPVVSGFFDAIVCYSSFPHFQDKAAVLGEMRRTLKSGGRLFICHTSGRDHINAIHTRIPSLCHDLLPGKNEMESLLVNAGFKAIQIQDEKESYFAAAEN